VNKADGERTQMAKQTKSQFQNALHFFPLRESGWSPKIILTSSTEGKGIDLCWKQIESFVDIVGPENFAKKRKLQNKTWFQERLSDWIHSYLMQNEMVINTLAHVQEQLINESISVSKAIYLIQEKIKNIVDGGA
jgi:LAO/AO transport system kinase